MSEEVKDEIIVMWENLKNRISEIDIDIQKFVGGNSSAGLRTRRKIRETKKACTEIIRACVQRDKDNKASN